MSYPPGVWYTDSSMKRKLLEQTALFFSIVKWTLLATLIGVIVGGATAFFLKSLDWSIHLVQQVPRWYVLFPLAGCCAGG